MEEEEVVLESGNRYKGEINLDEWNGHGTYTFVSGDRYEGHFRANMMDGYGIYYFHNGDVYKGDWKEDMMHGKGCYTFSDGDYYMGEWENDFMEGLGLRFYATKQLFYWGTWSKDKRTGGNLFRKDPEGTDSVLLGNDETWKVSTVSINISDKK